MNLVALFNYSPLERKCSLSKQTAKQTWIIYKPIRKAFRKKKELNIHPLTKVQKIPKLVSVKRASWGRIRNGMNKYFKCMWLQLQRTDSERCSGLEPVWFPWLKYISKEETFELASDLYWILCPGCQEIHWSDETFSILIYCVVFGYKPRYINVSWGNLRLPNPREHCVKFSKAGRFLFLQSLLSVGESKLPIPTGHLTNLGQPSVSFQYASYPSRKLTSTPFPTESWQILNPRWIVLYSS